MTRYGQLKKLRREEDLADLCAVAGDFVRANGILRRVTKRLSEIYGGCDPRELRERARHDLGHWA